MSKYRVIDADGHILEDVEGIWSHLEPRWQGFKIPKPMGIFPSLDGRLRGGFSRVTESSPELWGEFLTAAGIETSVLYPTGALAHGLIQDREWAVALAKAFNNWVHAYYLKADKRLKSLALLPLQDVDAAVAELRRGVTELGMAGGMLCAVTYHRKPLGHPDYHPIFAEAERLGCALAIHGAPQTGLGLEIFDTHPKAHILEHALPEIIHFISIIYDGVIEKYPGVRIAFLEAGAGWVPYLMDRLDYEYRVRPGEVPISKTPSELIRSGAVYVSCEAGEPSLPYVIERLGADFILYPTDFPHEQSFEAYIGDIREFQERTDLTDEQKNKILFENPSRFYRL